MREKSKILTLGLAVMLFLAGMAVFFVPIVTETAQINRDAEEYDELEVQNSSSVNFLSAFPQVVLLF